MNHGSQQQPSQPDGNEPEPEEMQQATQAQPPIVAVGVSAGDSDALRALLAPLSAQSGIAFVVALSVTKRAPEITTESLASFTAMPVLEAAEGMAMLPGHIYLITGSPLVIGQGTFHGPTEEQQAAQPGSIDSLFRSLAADQHENAICVILSGTRTEGASSLKSVKEHGGMVIVQAPESARFEAMPRSAVATGLADSVLALDEIGPRLVEYARYLSEIESTKGLRGLRDEAADHLVKICAILQRHTSHDFSRYKRSTLVRRIQHRLQVLRETSVVSYLKRLQEEPGEVELLFKDLLIGVTSFFRDPESFTALADAIIPKLFENRDRDNDGPVRVWVPGCASGEEAFTIAMLLSEYITARQPGIQAQIFATDIDDEALEFARMARYPESIADQLSPERLSRFFIRQANGYQVSKEIREMCIFSTHNLIKDPPFSRLDLISCRNMLIYLEHDIQKQVIPLFHYSLRSGGYLFLGPSESIAGHLELFKTVDKKHRVFQCKNSVIRPPVHFPMMEHRRLTRQQADAQRLLGSKEPNIGQTLERIILDQYAPACVIINEQFEILYFSGRTGNYLEQPSGTPSTNIINMARRGLRLELRTALHTGMKLRKLVTRENIAVDSGTGVMRINLVVRPMAELGDDSGLYMVIFQELGPVQTREQAAADGALPRSEEPIVQQLEHELRTTREYLQATIEELETSNEELTSSNEELLSMNEEIQSANEELQTSKEELQSVNEELQSVNEKLNKKVDELDRANSDLQNHFQSTQIATIFLDSSLSIKKFTPTATDVFRLIDSDIGRPIIDIAQRFVDKNLIVDIKDVLRNLSMKERQVHLPDTGAWHIMRILPYRTIDNVIDGVVITFVDITELKRAEEQITQLNRDLDNRVSELETLFRVLPVGVAISEDPEGRMVRLNAIGCRVFGVEPDRKGLGAMVDIEALPLRMLRDGAPIPSGEMLTRLVARSGEAIQRDEIQVMRADGAVIHLIGNASPLLDQKGKVRGVIATFADVTATTEARLQAEERAMQQSAAAELGVFALREASLDEVIAKAVALVHRTLGAEFVEVLELLPETETLLLKEGYGWKEGYVGRTVVGMGFDSQGGYTLASEEPVVVDDLSTEVRFKRSALLSDHGVVSGVSVIIYGKDRAYGALGAHTSQKRRFTRDAISFLQSVANVLGSAIQLQSQVNALARSEERYRTISELTSDYTFSFAVSADRTLELEWITESITRISGITAAEFGAGEFGSRETMQRYVHAEDIERVLAFRKALLDNNDAEIDYRIITRDGETRALRMYARPVWSDEAGRVVRIIGGGQDITERRQAEEQLESSRRELVDFIGNASVGLHSVDNTGRILWANNAELAMLGYTEEEYFGRNITEFHADRATIEDILARLSSGQAVINYEARLKAKDGSIRYVIIDSNALERDGMFVRTRCFTRDVTDRKESEDALRRSEEQFRRAIIDAPIPIIMHAEDGEILQVSTAFTRLTGYTTEDVPSLADWLALSFGGRANRVAAAVQRLFALETGTTEQEFVVTTRTGEQQIWNFTAAPPGRLSDGRRYLVVMATDITDRKRAEQERALLLEREHRAREQAEEAEARSAFLAEASGILAASLDYQTMLFSLARLGVPRIADYCYIFECEPESATHLAAYAHTDPEKLTLLKRVGEQGAMASEAGTYFVERLMSVKEPTLVGGTAISESKLAAPRGEWSELYQQLNPQSAMLLPLEVRGVTIGIMVLAFSESEREYDEMDLQLGEELARRAATALDNARLYREAQQANSAKDQFLAVLSHELRTPLTPALASVEALQEQDLPEDSRMYVGLIQRNIELEARLIDDLLDLTRIIKGKLRIDMDATDIHDLIRNVLDICQADITGKNLVLALELQAAHHIVRGDAARLQQVFWNILKNAVKFTPGGGRITLTSRNEGEAIVIEVIDTGIGIEEQLLPLIFNAFEQGEQTITRRFGGLGLGLAISKSLIDMHGGLLTAASAGHDTGATFTVTMPAIDA